MDFPLLDLLDEQACYDWLVRALHPAGVACPTCGSVDGFGVHRRHRAPVLDFRCACGRVFNAWTGTALAGTWRPPSAWVLILRGIAQGMPTAQLARELACSRRHLLELRHRLQQEAWTQFPRSSLADDHAEADEMYQNAGEKRHSAHRPRGSTAATRQ